MSKIIPYSVKLDPQSLSKLRSTAQQQNVSPHSIAVKAIKQYLDREAPKTEPK
jgi:predicted transcriptional regulator